MARTRSSCRASRKGLANEKERKIVLRFTKQQVDAFYGPLPQIKEEIKKDEIKREMSSPPPSLPSQSETRTGRKAPETITKRVRCVILRMWNGSRITLYRAEILAIRCGGNVYRHTIKPARCVHLS